MNIGTLLLKKRFLIKFWLLFFVTSITAIQAQTSNLLFESSFNHNVIVDKTVSWNHHLSGTDTSTNFTFPEDLPGDNIEHYFNYVVGDMDNYLEYANAEIVSTTGADGNPTNALYIEFIKDDTNFVSYSRVQYAMHGDISSDDPVQRMNQGYVKYKIKTHIDHTDEESDWRIPMEWKDMEDDGFRVGLYFYDTNTDSPYWVAKGQYMIDGELGDNVWQVDNFDMPVIEDDWFELEVYWYGHPDPNIGKLKVAVNGQILFDITNQTKDPDHPDKMYYFMPFKLYGAVGYSWITDFEYRDIAPTNSVLYETQVSIENLNTTTHSAVYPNPTSDFLYFTPDLYGQEYRLLNAAGQEIKTGVFSDQLIDLSDLKNGTYHLQVMDKNKVTNNFVLPRSSYKALPIIKTP